MDDKKLDLNLLLALEALLAESNVTRAAKRLNLSQPALSAQLNRLRLLFADELLMPTSRGVLPTALASELQAPLQHALDQIRALVGSARLFDPASATLTLTISSSDYMQMAVLLPFLLELNARAPHLKIMLQQGHDSDVVKDQLQRGDVDIAFLQSEDVENSDLRFVDVLHEQYIGIARKGSVTTPRMPLDQFVASRHIIVSPRAEGFRGATDDALAAIGLAREVAFAVSSFVFLVEAVSRSEFIALAPARLANGSKDRVDTFEPPVPVVGFRIAMVWHDRTHDHPARAWLREQLIAFCAMT